MFLRASKILIFIFVIVWVGVYLLPINKVVNEDKAQYFTMKIALPYYVRSEQEEDGFIHQDYASCEITRHVNDPSWKRLDSLIQSLPTGTVSDLDDNDYYLLNVKIIHGYWNYSFGSNGNLWPIRDHQDPALKGQRDIPVDFYYLEQKHITELEDIMLSLAKRELKRTNNYYCRLVVDKYNTYRLDGRLEDRVITPY